VERRIRAFAWLEWSGVGWGGVGWGGVGCSAMDGSVL
jgi:hypothetical protein